jgi:uncharacterized SAM-binding protein YcdF (DUF218 family)
MIRLRQLLGRSWSLGLLTATASVALGCGHLLRLPAEFLVVDDALEPGAAIVVLAGGFPIRELEAAELHRNGVASRLILVPERQNRERELRAAGLQTTSELRRDFLAQHGVARTAVEILDGDAATTYDELLIVARSLLPSGRPIVLVTSKYHARRVGVIWRSISGDRVPAIVRTARHDPFAPDRWWRDSRSRYAVIREYLGLADAWIGFPVARWIADRSEER